MSYTAEEYFDRGYRKGAREGTKKGEIIGIAKGSAATSEKYIAALLRDGRISPEQIAEILDVPLEEVLKIKEKIEA